MDEASGVPIVIGPHGLTGRVQLPPRVPDEYADFDPGAKPVPMGQAIPGNCRRVMDSPIQKGCPPGCAGVQRDGGCLCDIVRAAREAGVAWRFEVDPHDGFWDYAGDPIPGLVIERRDYGQVHTAWQPGHEPADPYADSVPEPQSFDCPHCGAHNEQDPASFHWWCGSCGRNANDQGAPE
jgi:hypothetical protein